MFVGIIASKLLVSKSRNGSDSVMCGIDRFVHAETESELFLAKTSEDTMELIPKPHPPGHILASDGSDDDSEVVYENTQL